MKKTKILGIIGIGLVSIGLVGSFTTAYLQSNTNVIQLVNKSSKEDVVTQVTKNK